MPHARPDGEPYYSHGRGCCVQDVISDGGGDVSAVFLAGAGGMSWLVALGSNYVAAGPGHVASYGLLAPVEVVTSYPLSCWLFS